MGDAQGAGEQSLTQKDSLELCKDRAACLGSFPEPVRADVPANLKGPKSLFYLI